MIEENRVKIKLADRQVKLVVKDLNKVLDEHRVFGQEWNKQVIKELILQNLSKDTAIKLIDELNELPISDWND